MAERITDSFNNGNNKNNPNKPTIKNIARESKEKIWDTLNLEKCPSCDENSLDMNWCCLNCWMWTLQYKEESLYINDLLKEEKFKKTAAKNNSSKNKKLDISIDTQNFSVKSKDIIYDDNWEIKHIFITYKYIVNWENKAQLLKVKIKNVKIKKYKNHSSLNYEEYKTIYIASNKNIVVYTHKTRPTQIWRWFYLENFKMLNFSQKRELKSLLENIYHKYSI